MSSFIAAGTAYATHGVNTIPFFIYYSMFGFQRVGDLIWAGADSRVARLPARRHRRPDDAGGRRAAAPGRPQPRLLARRRRTASPTTRRTPTSWRSSSRTASGGCIAEQESIFYYLTVMNEQYAMPPMPEGVARRHPEGHVPAAGRPPNPKAKLQGAAVRQRRDPERGASRRRSCCEKYDVAADVWSVTSYQELYRDGHACERWNMLHPGETPRVPVRRRSASKDAPGVLVAASDYLKVLPDSIDPLDAAPHARRSAPTASAAARTAQRCASSSRSTRGSSRSRRSPSSLRTARSIARSSRRRSRTWASTPRS